MAFRDLLDLAKAQAIKDKLSPTELSVYKSFCRDYSEAFHVPLPQVYLMNPEEVIGEVFAKQLDNVEVEDNIESMLEQIYAIEDPDYELSKEEELKDFIEEAEAEEEERVKDNRPIHRSKKRSEKLAVAEPENKPTGGTVDFSSLNDKNEK